MQKLYQKSELGFALAWIGVYVVGTSLADRLSELAGMEKVFSFPFLLLLSLLALGWGRKNNLLRKYGLCSTEIPPAKFMYYLPLLVLVTCNFWYGVRMNLSPAETALYVGSMICVGFLEELIFRGFLFRAMCRDGLLSAIVVSSVTFGFGHIVNLLNGSGMGLVANLCQVCYATAAGFLFVILFYRGGSLLPCIVVHSAINAASVFADEAGRTAKTEIVTAMILTAVSVLYALALLKTLPRAAEEENI